MMLRIFLLASLSIWATCNAEVELITEPRSGEEYVFVSGGQPQALKQSKSTKETHFETSHKIPEKLPTHYVSRDSEKYTNLFSKTKPKLEETEYSPLIDVLTAGLSESSYNFKRESGEGIIEIEDDKRAVKKDFKKKASGQPIKPTEIEIDLPLSKIENIKISEKNNNYDTNVQMNVELEPMSQSGKLIDNSATTTQKPVLTTVAHTTPRSFDVLPIHGSADSINAGLYSDSNLSLEEAGTEQKQTRVEIKKGPNGQDYEYEYVYYYYDDDADEVNETSSKKEAEPTPAVYNSHDGPQSNLASNQIKGTNNRNKNKYSSIERSSTTTTTTTTQAPESNEVLPGSRTRYRGRNIPSGSSDNEATDERLPANTRFPPRSRTTTPSVHDKYEDEIVEKPTRQKSRTQTEKGNEENVTQSKTRSRSNVRRPSLELVDSASFNTHSSDVSVSQYKEIRSRLNSVEDKDVEKSQKQSEFSRGSPRSREESKEEVKPVEENIEDEYPGSPSTVASVDGDSSESVTLEQDKETTEFTTMAAMDKVALELYAYIAGENSKNEINSSEVEDDTTADISDDATTTEQATTTEEVTTTTTAAPTTTTTTTTTTPAPTPSTTVKGGFRLRSRGGLKPKSATSTTTTESSPSAPKTRGRFGGNARPQFGRGRSNSTPNVAEQQEEGSVTKSEIVPVQNSITPSRARFGNRSRPSRTSTTAAPVDESSSTEGSVGSRLRSRPSLKLRGGVKRTGFVSSTTASSAPSSDLESSDVSSENSSSEPSSTTAKSLLGRGRLVGGLRPGLRQNPRLAIGGRANLNGNANANSNHSTIATSTEGSSSTASAESKENSAEQTDITTQQPSEVTVGNPLTRLRGRPRLQVTPAPKVKAPPPVASRRPSPLLARRRQQEPEVNESTPTSNENPTPNEPADSIQESNSASDETQSTSDLEAPSEEPSTEAAPKGISSLIARRRLVNRKPGTIL